MPVRIVLLPWVILFGLIVVGVVLAIVLLLSGERERTALKVIWIVPVLALVFILLTGFHVVQERRETARRKQLEIHLAAVGNTLRGTSLRSTDISEAPDTPTAEEPSEETSAQEEPTAAGDRPDWVEAAPYKDVEKGVYRVAIAVGPYSTRAECDRELPKELHSAVDDYVSMYLGDRARAEIRLPTGYIQEKIVQAEWEEQKRVRITPEGQIPEQYVTMPRLHVLLEFDHAANARIEEEWDKVVVQERLFGVGALSVLVLLLLTGVYGYLKIDLATGGAYRGRLRLLVAGLVFLLIAAGTWLCLLGARRPA